MTHLIDKSAVIAELNRLISELVEEGEDTMFEQGRISAFEDAKLFLDTLEAIEIGVDLGDPKGDTGTKTVFNDSKVLEISRHCNSLIGGNGDLEEAAKNYVGHAPEIDEDLSCFTKRNAFIAGAQWQEEQCQKTIELAEDHAYLAGQEKVIEKACEFIETYPHLFMGVLRSEVIEDFKNYIKKSRL